MNKASNTSKQTQFTEVNIMPSSGILVHSRTVVEKKDFVSTGILSTVDGDLLEVEIGDYKAFELSDPVKLTVYTPGGIFMFHSTIIAKVHGSLVVINPPENRKKFAEKRGDTRIDIQEQGLLTAILSNAAKKELEQPHPFVVKNISVSGIGFALVGIEKLKKEQQVEIELQLGFTFRVVVEIVRVEQSVEGHYYGAKIVNLVENHLNSLRAYIIKTQIHLLSQGKGEKTEKRKFR